MGGFEGIQYKFVPGQKILEIFDMSMMIGCTRLAIEKIIKQLSLTNVPPQGSDSSS